MRSIRIDTFPKFLDPSEDGGSLATLSVTRYSRVQNFFNREL